MFSPSFSPRLPTCPLVLEGLARAVGIHRVTWMTTWHQDYPPHQWCRAKWAMVRFWFLILFCPQNQNQDPSQCCHPAPCSDCCQILAKLHACLDLSFRFLLLTNFSNTTLPAWCAQLNPEQMAMEPFFISQLHAPNFAAIFFQTHH